MIEFQAYPTIALSVLFLILTFLVIRNSRTNVNLFFALGSLIFAIGTFLAGIGYIDYSLQSFWGYATACLILGPCCYFLAGKLIVDGDSTFRNISTYFLLAIGSGSSIATILYYSTFTSNENTIIWDTVIIVVVLFCSYEFYKVYQIAPELRQKISFLLFGLVIAIVSLGLNIVIIILTNQGTLLRTIIPVLGQILVVLAFTSIPDSFRKSKDETLG